MASPLDGPYSRVFTVSFCDTCSNTSVSMRGGSPYEISVESEHQANKGFRVTMISGVPKVNLEDILSTVRKAGVNEGTCSVKVNLTTKEVVFIKADKWDEHKCVQIKSFEDLLKAMRAKAKTSKDE